MLISIEESQRVIDLPIGIAVCQWELDGEPRMWVLYPQSNEMVEIDFASKEYGNVDIIKVATENWTKNEYGFGENEQGYPFNKEIANDIYEYWDGNGDYAMSHRIYEYFKPIIEHYKNDAGAYLERISNEEYETAITNAKKNGWDSSLIEKRILNFPY